MEDPKEDWDWLAFLSKWHETEYDRRYTLENVVTTPITLLTGVFGLSYLLITQFDYKHSSLYYLLFFLIPLAVALGYAFRSAVFVYRSYAVVKKGVYKNIPDAALLRRHMDNLVAHYKEHDPASDGVQKFKEYFVELLADQITVNVVNNDDRTINIQKSKGPIMGALLGLLLTMPGFLTNQLRKPDPTYQVTILPNSANAMSETTSPLPPPPPMERQILDLPRPTQPLPQPLPKPSK
ncbi:hypothetical protein [Hymenobacter ruricola]|uniref:DUF4199 domain-containing protein n=1 Tax=Hymenobacter ruricola TaxID=2791023 RepID=A0ABS0I463_9BACT|nr:hypothetical protein [Hymenobacter ruricola]MBF9221763.1 hypothetical protein [Hymenobacter ruricola]